MFVIVASFLFWVTNPEKTLPCVLVPIKDSHGHGKSSYLKQFTVVLAGEWFWRGLGCGGELIRSVGDPDWLD